MFDKIHELCEWLVVHEDELESRKQVDQARELLAVHKLTHAACSLNEIEPSSEVLVEIPDLISDENDEA